MGGRDLGIRRELPLERENGRYALVPERLRGGEDAQLVVDEHVTHGRVAPLDVVELELLVDVDEDVPVDAPRSPARSTLCGWKTASPSVRTTVGPSGEGAEHLQRRGVEAVGERVVEEEAELQEVRIADSRPVALVDRAQVVA